MLRIKLIEILGCSKTPMNLEGHRNMELEHLLALLAATDDYLLFL